METVEDYIDIYKMNINSYLDTGIIYGIHEKELIPFIDIHDPNILVVENNYIDFSNHLENSISLRFVEDVNSMRTDTVLNVKTYHILQSVGCNVIERRYKKTTHIDNYISDLDLDSNYFYLKSDNFVAKISLILSYEDYFNMRMESFKEILESSSLKDRLISKVDKDSRIVVYFTNGIFDEDPESIEYHILTKDELKSFINEDIKEKNTIFIVNDIIFKKKRSYWFNIK